MNYERNENPEQLKEEIERTRDRMSQRINTIQERLDPENLRSQAQDAVRGVMSDSADALVGYVKEHSRDLGESLVDAIKHYPVPTALIGFGIGWLLVERMTGSRDRGHSRSYDDSRSYRGSSYAGSSYQSGYGYGGPQSVPVYDQYGRRQDQPGIRYSYASQEQGGQGFYRGPQSSSYGYGEEDSSQGQGMLQSAKETVGNIADKVKQSAQEVQHAASQAGQTVQEFTSDMRERSGMMAGQMQDLGSQAQHFSSEAQYQAQKMGYRVQENIESNPLMFGAVALAVGAAVGMMLPSTRREDEMLGQWRDEVVHRAQELAGDVRERAQQVVEEVKPEFQQAVEKVKQDLTETGKSAMQELRHTAETAGSVAKEGMMGQSSQSSQTSGQSSGQTSGSMSGSQTSGSQTNS